jgi:hypothetical protein
MPITAIAVNTGCRPIVPDGVIEKMAHPVSPVIDTIAPVATMIPLFNHSGSFNIFFTGILIDPQAGYSVHECSALLDRTEAHVERAQRYYANAIICHYY